jgi:opacity protein-like surface antigen
MRRRLLAILAGAILSIPTICLATPPRIGPYVSGFIGVAVPTDRDSTGPNIDDRIEFDPSLNIGTTGGFDFGFVRAEGELSYKHGEIKRVNDRISGESFSDIDGRIGALAMMGNIFLDLHNPSPITPYIGGGVGLATLHQSDTFGDSSNTGNRTELYRQDDDTVFAYQVGTGLEIALNRRLSLDVGYRYFKTTKATFNGGSNFENSLRFESHNAAVGLRVRF